MAGCKGRGLVLLLLALTVGCVRDRQVLRSGDAGGARDATSFDGSIEPPKQPEPMIVWRFDEGAGERALDSSGSGMLVHLAITDVARVRWGDGALELLEPTVLVSEQPPTELVQRCRESGALTVEAWVRPAEAEVHGTRRIVTLSASPTERNFLLGQGGLFADPAQASYALRVRTTTGNDNGLPMLTTEPDVAKAQLMHVVAVHSADGMQVLYVDGEPAASQLRDGSFDGWDEGYLFAVGDEHGSSDERRTWQGELHHIAMYAEALSAEDVARLHAAGPER